MKTIFSKLFIFTLVSILVLGSIAAAPIPPQPNVTFEIVNGLPGTLNIGESYTVEIRVTSDVEFQYAMAMPAPPYPGKYVVFTHSERRSLGGTTATLFLTMKGKDPTTADFVDGVPVSFVVGARFKGGVAVGNQYDFNVVVP